MEYEQYMKDSSIVVGLDAHMGPSTEQARRRESWRKKRKGKGGGGGGGEETKEVEA